MIRNVFILVISIFSILLFNSFVQDRNKPTLFIIGDSTVKNGRGDGSNGQWGWGSFIGDYFDDNKINVRNQALGGTSTRTYYNNPKLWQQVLDNIKPGDYVIIQFGHNDSSPIVDTLRARGTIKGNSDSYEEVRNPLLKQTEMVYSYGFYLRRFVKNIQDKGAIPVICSPIPRNSWEDNKVKKSNYAEWAQEAAAQSGAFFIPLQDMIISSYEKVGQDVVKSTYFGTKDATHTIKEGAILNAKLVAENIKNNKEIGLRKFLK
ncbi:rhamnogalacturonan acetylesterase [Sphingobacterium bovistauri]|uniref:Rhamnogalacturonan acetylesterase n=1 Tax=Sphingobacterium bovistauri TaxID=2781959 RepID=A0ABS7Z0Z6_9SPHI|nr:rhamnogalacturonan acetylesterase [Sphingobacterium bovistauri]MCA5003848.1 rhamnogalacturonan acetylesterase [Sphingobacterium bovistauri]